MKSYWKNDTVATLIKQIKLAKSVVVEVPTRYKHRIAVKVVKRDLLNELRPWALDAQSPFTWRWYDDGVTARQLWLER